MASPNPLLIDPTRTTILRRRFAREISRRFSLLKRKVLRLLVEEDAFGWLSANSRWRFLTQPQQVEQFRLWVQSQIYGELLETIRADQQDYWLKVFIESAYRKGLNRAFSDVRRYPSLAEKLPFYQGTRAEFLRSAFGRPVSVNRVKLLAGRVLSDLQGITDQMAAAMTRELVDGMIQGKSPREVAREINRRIDGIGRSRARTIAQTETIRAHNEGQLDAMEMLGVDEAGVSVEWVTSGLGVTEIGNPSPCPLCEELEGAVFSLEEAHGLLPRHPNCRCSWVPANVGEDHRHQLRTKERIEAAVLRSIEKQRPSRLADDEPWESSWAGQDARISPYRPREIV